jgi:hypothetical protein
MGVTLKSYGWMALPALALLAWYVRALWRVVRRWPFFRLFDQQQRFARGLQFLAAYQMLHEAGCVDREIILELLNCSHGRDRDIYEAMHLHLAHSQDLQTAFNECDWSLTVRDGMSMFAEVDRDQQARMLSAMLETTQMESVHVTRQISRTLARLGFCLMILSVLTVVFGFYIPIITVVSHSF